ncbi:uncharacterized protein A4U43_C05F31680 [Asparagus officinalis]|uniref:Multidrug resistance protein n=1 Tax=Asparagus officinalis TaxID=4686 RepID=A0A5P1EVX0_ASPOF|nr:putative multidrug resistance protein isoform X2 [Asparagus officinalis]ONK70238.1 uncharacterized protein A4U43_C05F31680 [Asparagus officinalis]
MENGTKIEKDIIRTRKKTEKASSIWTIFMHADVADKWLMVAGFLSSVGDGFSMPLMLLITSKLMNSFGNEQSSTQLTQRIKMNALHMVYLACGKCVVCFLEGYFWTRTGERQASRMRTQYLKAVLRQDIEYFDLKGATASDVITSVSSDSLVLQDVLSEKMPNSIMNFSTFLGGYILAFILVWRMALVMFPLAILLIIPGIIYHRVQTGIARKNREEYSKAGVIVEQAISSIRTVYSFVGEAKAKAEFSSTLEGSVKLGIHQGLLKGIALGFNGLILAFRAFVPWYGSRMIMYHGAKGGDIFAVGASILAGGLSLGSALSNVTDISEATAAGERAFNVIRRVPKIDSECTDGEVLENVVGEVELKGVEFAYPSRSQDLVLRGLNLKVPTGKTVALVGGSGSGKSTVIALLQRFYDPDSGKILFDGVDIRKFQLKWLRSQMGLVSQEPALFAGSIKENILFGKEGASMDEVVAAAESANAHNFISNLPLGYESQVGEGGIKMSGGQKQRIAIARAIVRSPKILLLDEATSALDSESERVVQGALDAASVGRTTIVIAHRLSTIQKADIIALVQAGRIIEIGSHDELIRDESCIYSSLIRLQQTAPSNAALCSATSAASALPFSPSIECSNRCGNSTSRRLSHASRCSSTRSLHDALGTGDAVETEPEPNVAVPSFRRLLMLNAPEWKQALMGCLGALTLGMIPPLNGYINGGLISVYFLKDHSEMKSMIRIYALFLASLSVFFLLVNIVMHYNFGVMGEYLAKRVREQMFSKFLTFEVGWFDRDDNSTGAVYSRLAKDANVVRSLVGDRMSFLIQTLSTIAIAGIISLIISWRLATVMIAVQPIISICFYTRSILLQSMSNKAIKAQADSSKLIAESVSNIQTVTAFSSQNHILHLFNLSQDGPRRDSIRHSWFAGIVLGTSQSLTAFTFALIFWYGGQLVTRGDLSSRGLFQILMILFITGRVVANVSSRTADLAKGADAVSSVFAVLDRATFIDPEDQNGHCPEKLNGRIEIRNVEFAYPTRPNMIIFKRFSLDIDAGKSTALVGRSGSGKSTIIGLIERFYDPLHGTVNIDGIDLKSYNLRSLRRHIALVGQEPTLFSGSIRDNIAYGAEGAAETEIQAAAKAANAHGFISVLQHGYDTRCGDLGHQLSGGQKQRIAIARAILKNPAILLLDEATSALDSHSEKIVQEALEKVMVGRTSVVVAHRLSTIQNCDLIAVFENGTVVEMGSHSSLLAKGPNGSYCGLVKASASS